ncbi:MAG: SAM-dependent methyltransferase [Candidatus Rokuibacteriota bacterium]|nr:MAG: SAM-dependent methyltransferase [Candidatus Rokubacteria bacterium]
MDALAQFKAAQRQAWASFTPFELATSVTAPRLVAFAGVQAGQRVLDVGCGTGVVAITARRRGAQVTGLDLTPELLQRARQNAALAQADVEWHEGDAESLPFGDGAFDVVLSQFGHMFAPRPEVATRELLRVLKPGGRIAFSTWPPELCIGRIFTLIGRYLPPPPAFVSPPPQWGEPTIVRDRLGAAVTDLVFDRGVMLFPALSLAHYRHFFEENAAPVLRLVQTLQSEPERLAAFRQEFEAIATPYLQDNVVRQDYLMTRATKV